MTHCNTNTDFAMQKIGNIEYYKETGCGGETIKEDIISLLLQLGGSDADFTGDNGEEYLWDEAKERWFESNQEFLAWYVTHELDFQPTEVMNIIDAFANEWAKRDSYYDSITADIKHIGDVYAVVLTRVDYH